MDEVDEDASAAADDAEDGTASDDVALDEETPVEHPIATSARSNAHEHRHISSLFLIQQILPSMAYATPLPDHAQARHVLQNSCWGNLRKHAERPDAHRASKPSPHRRGSQQWLPDWAGWASWLGMMMPYSNGPCSGFAPDSPNASAISDTTTALYAFFKLAYRLYAHST